MNVWLIGDPDSPGEWLRWG